MKVSYKNVKIEKGNNLGFAKSFLTALDECDEADYYAFSDQDDVWEKDKLSTAIEILEEESQSTPLLYCSALQRVDENLNPLHVQSYHGLRINLPSMLTRGRLAGCTFVFNNTLRNLVKNSSQIEMHASHDSWVLLACLACGGNVFFDKKPHILFRRYNTNTSIDGGKLKSRLKYEFRYFEKYKNNRLDTACELLNCYNSNMSVSSKSFLEKVKNYKSSIRNRIAFLFYKDINCGIIASDVITRIIILFGCY